MENKLQELTQRIYQEGVNKANEEAKAILDKAKAEAEHIIKSAQKQAGDIVAKATEEASTLRKNTESELNMSVKQTVNAVKQQIQDLITAKSAEGIKDILRDDNFLRQILEITINHWLKETQAADLTVILPQDKQIELEKFFQAKAQQHLNNGLELRFSNQIKGGFKIGPKDGRYVISFTDEDFENLFKAFARPKLRTLLFGDK